MGTSESSDAEAPVGDEFPDDDEDPVTP